MLTVDIKNTNRDGSTWIPRVFQKETVNKFRDKEVVSLTIPRQNGKTEICIKILEDFIFFFNHRRNPVVLVAMQTHTSAADVYFQRLEEKLGNLPKSILTKQTSRASQRSAMIIKRPWFNDICTIYFFGESTRNPLRGRTVDLMILDEIAFYHRKSWLDIFKPMLDETKGKALLTSTAQEAGVYYDLTQFHKKQERKGSKKYADIDRHIEEMEHRSDEFIEDIWLTAINLDNIPGALQEYYNDHLASVSGQRPFLTKLNKFCERGPMPPHDPSVTNINFAMDIGNYERMPAWGFLVSPLIRRPTITAYENNFEGLYDLADKIFRKYHHYRTITLIFPHDFQHREVMNHRTRDSLFRDYLRQKGYDRKMTAMSIPKTADKKVLLNEALSSVRNYDFVEDKTYEGWLKLEKFSFTLDAKTGSVNTNTVVRNGSEHTADAFCHLVDGMDIARNAGALDGYTRMDIDEKVFNSMNYNYKDEQHKGGRYVDRDRGPRRDGQNNISVRAGETFKKRR